MTPPEAKVLIIATLDTKGPEAAYIRDGLNRLGIATTVIDTGILGEPLGIVPDVTHAELAAFGGISLQELQNSGTRGRAVERMRSFVIGKVREMFENGEVLGAIGMGGAEGSVMSAAALMQLPIGLPKIVLSPIASGRHEFGPLVGTSDMMVMHTVIDIMGLNNISETVYDNAVAAMAGMVKHGHTLAAPGPTKKYVALSILGNTNISAMVISEELARAGYEVITFHANGVGGAAMEELALAGQFVAVIELTPNEVVGTLIGGIHNGGPDRMKKIGKLGIPQLFATCCVDFMVFHTTSFPAEYRDRPIYDHNPEFALVRLTQAEMIKVADHIANAANESIGPMRIIIPGAGYSIPNNPTGVFWNRSADAAFEAELRAKLAEKIKIEKFNLHANSREFGLEVARQFKNLMSPAS